MAETLVENRICDACGADVRTGSMFCYNCGSSVQDEIGKRRKKKKKEKISDAWFKEEIAGNNDLKTTKLDENIEAKAKEELTEEAKEDLKESDSTDEKSKPGIQEEAKLKSAASMRRKAKTFQKKKIEVVWEESESTPSAWFVLLALVLVFFAVLIYLAAMYVK
jgi:hypothetical protein